MALDFGTGARLVDASPWMRDSAERHARILRVAEINSIIAGLPQFSDETRARLAAELVAIDSALSQEPTESPPTSDDRTG